MSADSWCECPFCSVEKAVALKKLEESYGKVSQEKYEDLKEKLMEEGNVEDEEYAGTPVREDYEFCVEKDGTLSIDYTATCQMCNASWEVQKKGILPEAESDKKLARKLMKEKK